MTKGGTRHSASLENSPLIHSRQFEFHIQFSRHRLNHSWNLSLWLAHRDGRKRCLLLSFSLLGCKACRNSILQRTPAHVHVLTMGRKAGAFVSTGWTIVWIHPLHLIEWGKMLRPVVTCSSFQEQCTGQMLACTTSQGIAAICKACQMWPSSSMISPLRFHPPCGCWRWAHSWI